MLLEIYIFLMSLSIIFIIGGFLIDLPFISLIGSVFLFGLGFIMLNGGVEVKTGENITFSYGDNNTISSQNIVFNYDPYDFGDVAGISYGWFIMFLGLITGIMVIIMAGD